MTVAMDEALAAIRALTPSNDGDLYECAECSSKPGSPTLCQRCVDARAKAGDKWRGTRATGAGAGTLATAARVRVDHGHDDACEYTPEYGEETAGNECSCGHTALKLAVASAPAATDRTYRITITSECTAETATIRAETLWCARVDDGAVYPDTYRRAGMVSAGCAAVAMVYADLAERAKRGDVVGAVAFVVENTNVATGG